MDRRLFDELIGRLAPLRSGPLSIDEKAAYFSVLSKYNPEVLADGIQMAIAECKFFPRPAEIREFCDLAAAAAIRKQMALPQRAEGPEPDYAEIAREWLPRVREIIEAHSSGPMARSLRRAVGGSPAPLRSWTAPVSSGGPRAARTD